MKMSILRTGPLLFTGLVALGAGAPAHAAEVLTGDNVVIGPDVVVQDDVYVAGGNVRVLGTVDGDLVLFAGEAEVDGVITGDVLAAGGEVLVSGDVVGSVRAAGGTLTVSAEVAEDAVLAGGTVIVPLQARVGRDVLLAAGDAQVGGIVGGDLLGAAGNLVLESSVGGDVSAQVGELTLGEAARIGGDLRYTSDDPALIPPAAVVHGETVHRTPRWADRSAGEQIAWGIVSWVRALMGFFLAGLLLVAVFPGFTRRSEAALRARPVASLAAGLLAVVGVPLVLVLILVAGMLLGGWWIALIGGALLAICMVVGVLVAGVTVGDWMLARFGRPSVPLAWALLAGLVLLLLASALPYVGGLVFLAAMLFGLGALALAGVGGRRTAAT